MSNPSLNRIISRIVRKVSLGTTVRSLVPVLPVLVVVGLAGYLYSSPSDKSVQRIATQLQKQIADRIEENLEHELSIPERIVTQNVDAIAVGLLKLDNLSPWESYLKRQIQPTSPVSTIAVANLDRELVSVKKLDGRVFIHTTERNATTTNRSTVQPALPSWYTQAIQARQRIWSEASLGENSPQRSIGIAQPIYDRQGTLAGVVACFLSLENIRDLLLRLNLGSSGRAFIVDRSGHLLASSVVAELGTSAEVDSLATDSSDRLIQATANYLKEQFDPRIPMSRPQQLIVNLNGTPHFLRVMPFTVARELDWSIVVVFPQSDWVDKTHIKTRTILGLSLVAFSFAAIASLYIRRQIDKLNPDLSITIDRSSVDPFAISDSKALVFDRPDLEDFNPDSYGLSQPHFLPISTRFSPEEISRVTAPPPYSFRDENRQTDRPVRLLIVDHSSENLATCVQYLSPQQYQIARASSSVEALTLISDNGPADLILFEAQFFDISGHEFCQKIRERFRFYELPIIVLTESVTTDLAPDFWDWGANDYLTKPIVKHELISRIRTHLHLAHLNAAYSRFVPKQFLQLLQKDSIVDVKLGDNTLKEMSILFSDIRSFTSMSEKMTPEENFRFINSYLSRMEPVIMANQGFIDKYIGDSIMALFSGSADDAIQAGISMLKTLVEYNQHRANVGYPPIKIGIGINTGSLMLGTVGGINRMDGTVISDAVNLASRIESLTKEYGVSLLISHQTFAQIQHPSNYKMRLIERLKVKGKSKAVAVFEVFDGDPPALRQAKLNTAGIFEEGVLSYYGSSFRKAAQQFEECLRQNPEDKVAQIYLDRCRQYQIN